MSDVFIDSKYIGKVDNGKDFIEKFISERRIGKLPAGANIFYDDELEQVWIEASKGRAIRPLIIVKEGKSLLT